MCILIYTYVYIHMCIYMCIYLCAYICMYICTYIYTHTNKVMVISYIFDNFVFNFINNKIFIICLLLVKCLPAIFFENHIVFNNFLYIMSYSSQLLLC